MKKIQYLFVLLISFLSCNTETPTQFSEEVLNDVFITLDGDSIVFKDILENHKNQDLVIDIWASWCGDCIEGLPKLKALQNEYTDVTYIFLSLDRTEKAWKNGVKKYKIDGQHYFMKSGWNGAFGNFVDLDWIPRYMVVDKTGTIKLFEATKADDKRIKENL
ncbi:TlpA disulfide reductase family protein [Algibacter aquimarinus]|uniref:TlpA disulfide reductase family protein n=1 Tax=Algibacter aquimarinus TaxID=1136748 RepID=A0ABP9H533_9FLAO